MSCAAQRMREEEGKGGETSEAAVVRVMNYTLAEGHDDEVPVIRKPEECPSVAQLSELPRYPYTYTYTYTLYIYHSVVYMFYIVACKLWHICIAPSSSSSLA